MSYFFLLLFQLFSFRLFSSFCLISALFCHSHSSLPPLRLHFQSSAWPPLILISRCPPPLLPSCSVIPSHSSSPLAALLSTAFVSPINLPWPVNGKKTLGSHALVSVGLVAGLGFPWHLFLAHVSQLQGNTHLRCFSISAGKIYWCLFFFSVTVHENYYIVSDKNKEMRPWNQNCAGKLSS